jgi:hypothetical protein
MFRFRWIVVVLFSFAVCAPAFGQDITSNLLGHWKLIETSGTTATDSSSTANNGTYTNTPSLAGSTEVTNIGAKTAVFSAASDEYVLLPNESFYDITGTFTLSAWIRVTSFTEDWQAILAKGDGAWRLTRNGANNTLHFAWGSPAAPKFVNSTTSVNTGNWYHVAGVYNGSTVKIYINGVEEGSVAASGAVTTNNYSVRIGHNAEFANRHWNGAIFDARVYNRALSPTDVTALYQLKSLIAHWKLNESSGSSAADSADYNHTATVTGTASWGSAVLNNGFSFNGSTKIEETGLIGSPSSFTIAAWANLTTADSSGSEIISLGDRVYLRLDESSASKVAFYNGASWVTASFSTAYALTGWHHFAGVFNNTGDSLTLYVDGVQVATTATVSNVSYSGAGANTVIGRHGNSGTNNDFTGAIDDVRIYNYALSADEVATLHGLVGKWKLDHTSGTTATDSSPFANNGTVTGTANWSTDCGGMRVFDFNGSTNYVSVTNESQLQPTEAITIAAWIKGDSWGAGTDVDTILRKGDNQPNNYKLEVADGKLELGLDANDDAGIQSIATLATGQWYHVAATWNGSTVKLYINGVLDSSTAYSGTIGTDTRALYIGGRSGADLFDGMIRDVYLYNRALNDSEIEKLAGLIGYWAFSEGSGTTAADSSGQGNNATLSGGASWTTDCAGNNNALLTNGAGGIAQTASKFSPPDVGTVAFWLRSTGAPATTARILGLGGDWEIRQQTDGRVIADLCGDGGTTVGTTTPLSEAGRWYHFTATFDSSNEAYAIYVDGQLEVSGTNSAAMSQQAANFLSFGTRTGSSEYWSGALRDVRVYSRKLCPSEIAALYGATGYWNLDETSGTTANNAAPSGADGTYVGGVTLGGSGPTGTTIAAQFDGTNDYVSLPTDTADYSKGFTIAAWARPTSAASWARFVDIGGGSDINNLFLTRYSTTSTMELAIHDGTGGAKTYVRASNTIDLNSWHHYAGTVNAAGVAKLYKDGAEISITSGSAGYPNVGLPTNATRNSNFIGRSNWAGDAYYQGKLYDVRIYSRALCPTEILQIYEGTNFTGVQIIEWVEIQ